MSYRHIDNLYKDARILAFRECYALEKVHGTSAHVAYRGGRVVYSSGGASAVAFTALFDEAALTAAFVALGHEDAPITVFGEAYGGKEQGMSATYGKALAFVAFEVMIGESWLDVPSAEDVARKLGIEFVPYAKGSTDLAWVDSQRDADSEIAIRRGTGPGKKREGVVLRPPFEVRLNSGERLIVKHKRDEFRETKSPRPDVDPAKLAVLAEATAIAEEWVTEMRLTHVLQKIAEPHDMSQTPLVIAAMVEDVLREAVGEIVDSKEARKAIGVKAATLFKSRIKSKLYAPKED